MFPNSNEVQHYLVMMLVAMGSAGAAKYGVDGATLTTIVSGGVALVAAAYGVYRNHNSKLVPETAQVAIPNKSTPSAMTGVRSLFFIIGATSGLLFFMGNAHAQVVTKAPPVSAVVVGACTPQQCSGFYVGGFMGGVGSNADIVGNGINGSVFAGGGIPGFDIGAQYWNGTWFAAAEAGFGWQVSTAVNVTGVNGNSVGGNENGFLGYQIAKVGGSLAGILGNPSPIDVNNFPSALLANLISPYILAGVVERQWGTGWATGAGVEFAMSKHAFLDLKYMYVNYGQAAQGNLQFSNENLILASLNYKF